MIYLKSANEVAGIKKACAIFKAVKAYFTIEKLLGKKLVTIDRLIKQFIEQKQAKCAFHGYLGFPGFNCLSLNQTVIHGVADQTVFKDSDKLTLDIGIDYHGYLCDAAFTLLGNKADPKAVKLLNDVEQAFSKVIEPELFVNNPIGNLSNAIQTYFENKGYFLVKEFGGHGCGIKIHEDPLILNWGEKNQGIRLQEGMVICIEPMVMTDSSEITMAANNWNVLTLKSKFNCHVEQMYHITNNGFECLTN
ncbi:type I methionyl aminopeptidase [Mycoplasmoides genitalium]|uniref:type I methionyl aminopeptidase n=1 Tax=Mycoplasmoides genitalium TaxID=2097 RepID=UPI002FCE275B